MPTSWKISLPCTRNEGEAISHIEVDMIGWGETPVIVSEEVDASRPDQWVARAYFSAKPGKADQKRFAKIVGDYETKDARVEKLKDDDWVTISQAGLAPIATRHFYVHTPEQIPLPDPAIRNLCIPAGLAFGTGHHETTHGCITMLERMRKTGLHPRNIIDIGTGTGLLAFAARSLWSQAYITASDVDPVCLPVLQDNATANAVPVGSAPGHIMPVIADGLDHPILHKRTPYDLIIANILAGPLITMAPSISAALQPGGNLLLAGLLSEQADAVIAAYRWHRLRVAQRIVDGDWTILWLRKRKTV